MDIPQLVEGYLRHAKTRADADFWAYDAVCEIVRGPGSTPEDAWDLVQAIVARVAPGDEALIEYVAAGPVEDLVIAHGATLVDRIEAEAAANPHFRAHLAGIWLVDDDLPPDVLARIVAASGWAIQPVRADELPTDDELFGQG